MRCWQSLFGVKNLPSSPPLNVVHRASSLDHRHKNTWWQECFFLDDLLPWFDEVLDRGSLMAMLHRVWWWVRWRRRCVVCHDACNGLFRPYLFLKHLAERKEFPALDEEMC
jgi:hypothetical protein